LTCNVWHAYEYNYELDAWLWYIKECANEGLSGPSKMDPAAPEPLAGFVQSPAEVADSNFVGSIDIMVD